MRIPLLDQLLRRLGGGKHADLEAWEAKHRVTIAEDLQKIFPLLPEAPVFVDVGANLGLFSEALLAGRPAGRGYLFEPVAELFERCSERFAGDDRVHIQNFGLAHEPGTATIYKARYNPGGNSLVHELMFDKREVSEVVDKPDHVEETVRLEVFDEFARKQGIERVDFVKTDTEGFDYRVLSGMLDFLATCDPLPVLMCELMSEEYHPFWEDQLAVVERLYALGYKKVDLSDMDKVQDIVFVPEGR